VFLAALAGSVRLLRPLLAGLVLAGPISPRALLLLLLRGLLLRGLLLALPAPPSTPITRFALRL
jgi:hypothetical protein